jgi:hypothetical protein
MQPHVGHFETSDSFDYACDFIAGQERYFRRIPIYSGQHDQSRFRAHQQRAPAPGPRTPSSCHCKSQSRLIFPRLHFRPPQPARTSVRPFCSIVDSGLTDRSCDAKELQNPDLNPRQVEFVPCKTVPRRTRMCVVVVPTFTEGEKRDPPVVARIILGREPADALHVSGRIYQPRCM